jgi:nicotinate-nucleotide adenylyltransferase
MIERIGLYGGSFNPPHMAHVLVAAWALATGEVSQIWVIPTGGHPFGKRLAPFEDRLEMCRRAFGFLGERVQILDIEREPRVHYSIETLRELQRRHPRLGWRWVMGSDTLEDAPQWREFDELMRLAPPLIIPRQGYENAQDADSKEFALPNISSTLLRRRLAEGPAEGLDELIPGPVLEWIRQKSLYQRESDFFNPTRS